ncbi:hypothetical protein ACFONC_07515 [Luteimonas soli]|uniref:Polymer-forming cytoskeletal protein n=1 Tax=Luteimonas soli TaxID=1648966 RepID=A0ABV7XMI6_9GAMM
MPALPRLPLAFALSLLLASGAVAAAPDGADIDKVNGSITAESGQVYGDLDTVNGSIRLEDGAHAKDAETVNGSVKAGNDIEAEDVGTVNGEIHIGERARIGGRIETVNGGVFVGRGGNVAKGIETVNGAIGIVATELGGSIVTVNGDITVGVDSHVRGGLKVHKQNSTWLPIQFGSNRKPRIVIGPNAVVEGDLVFEREVTLYVHSSARIGKVIGATPVAFDTPRAPRD